MRAFSRCVGPRLAVLVTAVCLAACGPPRESTPDAGPLVSAAHFTFECPRHGVAAFDATRSPLPGAELPCSVHVGGLDGSPLAGVSVRLFTEAGRLLVPTPSSTVGVVDAVAQVAEPLPLDVAPAKFSWTPVIDATHTGEPLVPAWMHPEHWVENPVAMAAIPLAQRTYSLQEPRRPDPIRLNPDGSRVINNPRDHLVTMIAVAHGEEAFTDTNANGRWDPGEDFVDQTEPFVDANDNGTWDSDEVFVDVNGNGVWDGKNGMWDGTTQVWAQERVLWTGVPALEDVTDTPGIAGFRKVVASSPASVWLTCPGTGSCTLAGPPAAVTGFIADPWFNALSRQADGDGCVVDPEIGGPLVIVDTLVAEHGQRTTYPPGDELTAVVHDARDPLLPPAQQMPKRVPAATFNRTISCTFSGSAAGPSTTVPVPIGGTVE